MTIHDFALAIKCEIVEQGDGSREISNGYTSDLLSDVMGNASMGAVLITVLAHRNTVAVATQIDLSAILVCSNRTVPADMITAAREHGIAILRTSVNQFVASYRAHAALFG